MTLVHATLNLYVYVNSTICMCELHCCFIQVFCAMHYLVFLAYGWSTAFYMSKCTAFVLFVHLLTTIVKLPFNAVSVFDAGAPGFEEVTQLIDHYFAEGDVGASFDQSLRRPVLSETQSQSVDGIEEVTQDWMVSEQLRAYELKQRNKKLRFESDSKEYAEKEKERRGADRAKSAKFVKDKQHAMQKNRLSSVVEEGGTPRWSPRVVGMNKHVGNRTAKASAKDP